MLRHVYLHSVIFNVVIIISSISTFGLVVSVNSRSLSPGNFTVDKSEVPARYVFEIDEVPGESSDLNKSFTTNQNHSNSSLMFGMPIAVAIFFAVIFLICCFCCLRCAITYDGIKRSSFYGGLRESKMTDIVKKLQLKPEPTIKK